MSKVNSMYFENLDTAMNFIKTLLETSLGDNDDNSLYCDLHVYQEEQAVIVEWTQVPFDHEFGGTFRYVDEDEEVMMIREFPDNHYDYFHDEAEYKEILDAWLKENPGWKRNDFGRWYKEDEVISD